MKIFKKDIIVTNDDLDNLNHVNNVRYIQWIEDVIKFHWLENASEHLKKEYLWVVLNHNVYYKNPAFLGDRIKFRTEVLKIGGATSNCLIEMYDAQAEKTYVTAETRWCLLNAETHRPSRITEDIKAVFTEETFTR